MNNLGALEFWGPWAITRIAHVIIRPWLSGFFKLPPFVCGCKPELILLAPKLCILSLKGLLRQTSGVEEEMSIVLE